MLSIVLIVKSINRAKRVGKAAIYRKKIFNLKEGRP
jgi:hypothetical protein